MKYDFNNSTYVKFWESNERRNVFQELLDKDLIGMNYGFWATQFQVDPYTTPRDNKGIASFTSKLRTRSAAGVLDMRAPLGDADVRDKQGIEAYSGSIPDFIAKAYVETANEREYKERMFAEYFGNDAQIILQYAEDVQAMIDDADQTLNYMAGQVLSTGTVDYKIGDGIKTFVYESPIPAENMAKAGATAWSDTSVKLLDVMAGIEDKYLTAWGSNAPLMKWQFTEKAFRDVVLKNQQVIEWVKSYRTINDLPTTDTMVVTVDMFNQAIATFPGLSPIEVVKEKEKDSSGIIKGWDDKIVVYRPRGYAGYIRRADILDKKMSDKYGASTISKVFARAGASGIYTLVNTTLDNGNYKEWHTDLMVAAVPSLDEWLYHVIVDTSATE